MKIGVVIPWRPQPSRIKAFEAVCSWYETNLPEAKIYLCDSGSEVWEMSATRNLGVKMAEEDGCDVIIMNDADTIGQIEVLKIAIEEAFKDNMIHNPYSNYYYIHDPYFKNMFFDGKCKIEELEGMEIENACSGINIFTPKAWWDIGGNDEKFKKWGFEDTAQNMAHKIYYGVFFIKHVGVAVSFSHRNQDSLQNPSEQLVKNENIFKMYEKIFNESIHNTAKAREEIINLVKSDIA